MTKRYFTCPIQALYMMKNFDVKFYVEMKATVSVDLISGETSRGQIEQISLRDFLEEVIDFSVESILSDTHKIYVAAESEHIFESKEGDVGLNRGDIYGLSYDNEKVARATDWGDFEEFNGCRSPGRHWKIVEREGKLFFSGKND